MLDSETKNRINTARDILVGKVPDPKSQVEQITIALIYKFMDDMDVESEEMGGKRTFFSGEFSKYAWRKIFDPRQSGHELLNLYSEAIAKMDTNPGVPKLFRDIFKNAYLPYRDPETLKSFLKIINEFEYSHSEKLGDAFEFLLSILGSQGDAGQFRTPRHIIDFMVAIIDPKKHEVILDPACGTAGFLISSYKHIIKQNSSNYTPDKDPVIAGNGTQTVNEVIITSNGYSGDKLTANERSVLADNMHGYDISPDMVRLSLVNMYLHGIKEPQIFEYDSLTSEDHWNEYSDVILANPPFMSPKGGIRPHKRFSVQSNRSEVLFVDYIAEHLTQDGRAAVIVPEGIIFQSGNAYKQLRKMLVEKYLVGVISLPAGVFNPYSGVKTSILWLDKSLAKKTDNILFVKIENDGFDLGAQRRAVKGNDLPALMLKVDTYKKLLKDDITIEFETNKSILVISKDIISDTGDYNLSGERYKQNEIILSKFPLIKVEDALDKVTYSNKILNSNFKDKGQYPIIDQSLNFIAGYWDKEEDLFKISKPVIIFGDHTRCFKYIDFDFVLGADGIKILQPDSNFIPRFFYYLLREVKLPNLGYSRHYKALKDKLIPLPPISVQQMIIAEIQSYQKIIDGARQVVENYKPRIDIDPEWDKVLLGDHIDFVSGVTLSIPDCEKIGGTPIISMNSLTEDGELVKEGIREIELPNKKNINYLQKGDLLFNWRNGSTRLVGKTGYFDWDGVYVFASFLLGIRTHPKSYTSKFLWLLLNQYRADGMYISFMRQNVNGLFNREELKILEVPLPSIEEQQLVAYRIEKEMSLIRSVKEVITIYEQKIKDRIAKVWGE